MGLVVTVSDDIHCADTEDKSSACSRDMTQRQSAWLAKFTWVHCSYMLASCLQREEEVGREYSPLHACWSALLEQMLTSGHTNTVLKVLDAALPLSALLMPHEAHQLVEHSRTLSLHGRTSPPQAHQVTQ